MVTGGVEVRLPVVPMRIVEQDAAVVRRQHLLSRRLDCGLSVPVRFDCLMQTAEHREVAEVSRSRRLRLRSGGDALSCFPLRVLGCHGSIETVQRRRRNGILSGNSNDEERGSLAAPPVGSFVVWCD